MEMQLLSRPHADRAEDAGVADQSFEFAPEIVSLDPVDLVSIVSSLNYSSHNNHQKPSTISLTINPP
jgi:hypothetical protein